MGGHDPPGVRQALPWFGLGFEDKNGKFELGREGVRQKASPFLPWKTRASRQWVLRQQTTYYCDYGVYTTV